MRFVSAVNGGRSTGREQENDGTKKENENGEGHQQLAAAKKKYIFLDAIQSDKERKKQLRATYSQRERARGPNPKAQSFESITIETLRSRMHRFDRIKFTGH